ncbi:MAG: hypothetical protein ACYCWW_01365 [Deltaproteobacteria bacterium]
MRAMTFLLVAGLLLPGMAEAQYQELTVTVDQAQGYYSGTAPPLQLTLDGCRQALAGTVTPGVNGVQLGYPLQDFGGSAFWATDTSCTSADGGATFTQTEGYVQGTVDYVVNVNGEQVVSQATGLQDPCDSASQPNGTLYLCVSVPQQGSIYYPTTTNLTWYMQLSYDMRPPPAPTGVSPAAADSQIVLGWTFASNGITPDHFLVYSQPDTFGGCDGGIPGGDVYARWGEDGGVTGAPGDPGDPSNWNGATQKEPTNAVSATLTNLQNGNCYDMSVRAYYVDGTPGEYSQPVASTPIEILDYWRLAHEAGLQDPGGPHCASASGGLPPLAWALAGLFFLRRRRRW